MSGNTKINGRRAYRVLAERALGRVLKPEEVIHHVDEDRDNNANNNLVICPNHKYHMLLHRRAKALEVTGDVNSRQCYLCKEWDDPTNMTEILQKSRNSEFYYHKGCAMANYNKKKAEINPRRNLLRRIDRTENTVNLTVDKLLESL